jgi:hypothetical protein
MVGLKNSHKSSFWYYEDIGISEIGRNLGVLYKESTIHHKKKQIETYV